MRLQPAKLILCVTLVVVAGLAAAFAPARDSDLTVHEWGTFTTVAGQDGRAINWRALSGPTDLPCFVYHYQNDPLIKVSAIALVNSTTSSTPVDYGQPRTSLMGRVRMETPVLYFYAPEKATVSVHVQFPRGMMTEWYPQASVSQPAVQRVALSDPNRMSSIQWPRVTIRPAVQSPLPRDVARSHYYAARGTDAALLESNGQSEKFLFYRGLADFDPGISAEVLADGAIRIRNLAAEALPAAILFENRAGRIGYRMLGALKTETTVRAPALDATVAELRGDLQKLLVRQGLYEKEAVAMVDTWRDSWFEEGTRVFYVVPPAAVERILPLRISPAPTRITRVFVGRMDVITPVMEQAVEQALTSDSDDVIERFGRLLEPITDRILLRTSDGDLRGAATALKADAFARYATALSTCK